MQTAEAAGPAEARPPFGAALTLTPRDLLRILRFRWPVSVAVFVLCLAASWLLLSLARPVYVSHACVHVEYQHRSPISDQARMPDDGQRYMNTQLELLTTSAILKTVVDRPEAADLELFAGAGDRVAALRKACRVSCVKNTQIIRIEVTAGSSRQAALLCRLMVEAYLDYHGRNTRTTASEFARILEQAGRARDVELHEAMQKVIDFRREHGVLFLDPEKGNMLTDRLARLSEELTQAELEHMQVRNACATVDALDAAGPTAPEILLSPGMALLPAAATADRHALAAAVQEAQQRLARLAARAPQRHPSVVAAAAECEAAQARLAEYDARLVRALRKAADQRLEASAARVRDLREAVERQRQLATDHNALAIEYQMLMADLQRKTRLCEALESRLKETDVSKDVGSLNLAVLEWPQESPEPAYPRKGVILLMGAALGVVLGAKVMLLWHFVDGRIRDRYAAEAVLNLPLLGEIPVLGRMAHGAGAPTALADLPQIAEVCRAVRAGFRATDEAGQSRVVLVTSPEGSEGKSTIAAALASALARTGSRSLLVDANHLRPALHRCFDVPQAPGLCDLLEGTTPISAAIRATAVAGLDLLAFGVSPGAEAPQPVPDHKLSRLLEMLSLQYDHIVVDAPPVLAAARAPDIGPACDATVLVLRAGKTSGARAVRAIDLLQVAGATVFGAVLNCARPERSAAAPARAAETCV